MKKKILLSLATIGSVIAPVATVVACGDDARHSLGYKPSDKLIKGGDDDFFGNDDVYEDTFTSDLSKYDKQVSFILYDQEVEAAYALQLGDLEFKQFKKEQEKMDAEEIRDNLQEAHDKESDEDKKKSLQTQIDAKKKEIKDLQTDIDDIIENIKTINDDKVDFDASSFGYDFPLLLKPFDNIKKTKEKSFNDYKDNFMDSFGPVEGAKKWPEEMRNKYGGSETEEESILWLASNEIGNIAKGAFTFKINSEYTVEQYVWAVVTKNKHWKFLSDDKDRSKRIHINEDNKQAIDNELAKDLVLEEKPEESSVIKSGATPKDKVVDWDLIDTIKEEKIYFISSNSKKVLPLDKETEADFVAEVPDAANLIKVQNGIMPFVRQDNPNKAWVIDEAALKKLLYFFGKQVNDGNGNHVPKQGMSFFFDPEMYGTSDAEKDHTTMALHLGTTDSTSEIQGSLGIKETLEYVRTMKPGFGLGVLKIKGLETGDASLGLPDESEIDFADLNAKANAKLNALFTKYHISVKSSYSATEMNLLIDKLFEAGKEDVVAGFGSMMRDFFEEVDSNNNIEGGALSYKIKGTSNNIVMSDYGMHIVRVSGTTDLPADVKDDLDNMAKEQKENSSTGIAPLVTSTYADQYNYYSKILGDAELKKEFEKKIEEYNKNIEEEDDKLSTVKLEELIKRIHMSNMTSKVGSSINNGSQIDWYKTQLDNKLKNPDLTVDEIYALAKKMVKVVTP